MAATNAPFYHFEQITRAAVIATGGPARRALPYV
jgi:hypothetical protein